ncbi:hypothetical protein JTB14_026216 [Gonioctena quinquepunctata]|nr:hypothetical protein JTB14_026216 [Gonioctena quinquepunctata]
MLKSCRLCQSEEGEVPIDELMAKIVFQITKVQINDELSPSLPPNVCRICRNKVLEIQNFIEMVQRQDEYLRRSSDKKELQSTESTVTLENCVSLGAQIISDESIKTDINPNNPEDPKRNSNIFSCPVCLKLYRRLASYTIHRKIHRELYCKNCDTHHEDPSGRTKHRCEKAKQFDGRKRKVKTKALPEGAVKTDSPENKYDKCDNFDLPLDDEGNLTKCHKEVTCSKKEIEKTSQNGKRPFLCVTCGKDFTTKNSLTCHEKIHSVVKAHHCHTCNLGFSVRSNLRAHIRKYHEGMRFYCSQCTKQFLSKCSLDRHEKIHAGVREFKCESCASAFYTRKELLKHQRYHQGSSDGRLSQVPSRKQKGFLWKAGLRRGLGRVQPFLSLLLHVSVGEAEQSVSALSAGMVHPEDGQIEWASNYTNAKSASRHSLNAII